MWRSEASTRDDAGSALLAVMLVLALGLTLAGVLALLGASESRVAAAHRDAFEARYAAESALDRAVLELQALPSWDDALAGVTTSSLTVGAGEVRGPGVAVDLDAETHRLQGRTDAGPGHGPDTPRWRAFLWAALDDLAPASAELESPFVVVAWVADDEAEKDGDATGDSNQAVWVHAAAFGPGSAAYRVEALVVRTGPGLAPLRRLVWRAAQGGD
jgi:Tfp pilus assembly protein PilX